MSKKSDDDKAAAKAAAKAADAKPKEKKRGVGDVAIEAIKAGKTNDEALAAVKKEFPDAKTSLASVNWYRNKLRASDKSVPTMRELNKKAKDAAKNGPDDKPDPLD